MLRRARRAQMCRRARRFLRDAPCMCAFVIALSSADDARIARLMFAYLLVDASAMPRRIMLYCHCAFILRRLTR